MFFSWVMFTLIHLNKFWKCARFLKWLKTQNTLLSLNKLIKQDRFFSEFAQCNKIANACKWMTFAFNNRLPLHEILHWMLVHFLRHKLFEMHHSPHLHVPLTLHHWAVDIPDGLLTHQLSPLKSVLVLAGTERIFEIECLGKVYVMRMYMRGRRPRIYICIT